MKTIGFIGAGQMAQALAAGIDNAYSDVSFEISDPSDEAKKLFCSKVNSSVQIRESAGEIFRHCDAVFLAIKPQYFHAAIKESEIQQSLADQSASPLVISIVAGISIDAIASATGIAQIARVMPNTPCLIMEGASAVSFSESVPPEHRQQVLDLLGSVGTVASVPENLMDSVTGLSGSGPAYVYTFIESLIDAGVLTGLPRDIARKLAIQTVVGAAKLVAQTEEHPAVLRDRVTSPGGTTIAGLKQLEVNDFRGTVIQAVEAATKRARELGAKS